MRTSLLRVRIAARWFHLEITMIRFLACLTTAGFLSLGLLGCSDTSSTTTEKTMKTPTGTTEIKTETSVEKSGSNPPPANP